MPHWGPVAQGKLPIGYPLHAVGQHASNLFAVSGPCYYQNSTIAVIVILPFKS